MIEAPPQLLGPDARRSRAWQAGAIGAALALGALANPDRPLPFDVCGFKLLTGLPCPTCGMTRALCHVLHGQWSLGIASHPAGPILAVGLVGWMLWSTAEAGIGRPLRHSARRWFAMVLLGAGVTVSAAFWVGQLARRI